jgi:hypothetical protein
MTKIVKKGGQIMTIFGMATLEELRRVGGTAWILKLFVKRKEKRKEHKAAAAANASWNYLFLSPSQEDLSVLASHLASGAVKPVLDGVWDFHSDDSRSRLARCVQSFLFGPCKRQVRCQDRRLIVKDAFLRFLVFMQTLCCGEFIS